MKKLLLTSAIIASSLLSFAQNQPQVPNGDFEGWVTGVSCSSQPSQYITASDLFYDEFASCPTSTGITKSTTTYSGSSALQLSALNFMTADIGNVAYLGTSTDLDDVGVAFTGRPTKLIGYTKFTKGGSDTLGVFIVINDANGDAIAFGELSISSTQSAYTKFEITLDYGTNTNAAASLIIGFGIGDANDGISSTTVALIDALTFEYPTATSTTNYSAISPINVYAANKNINFSENVSDVRVVDMVGANKMQETATTKTLNAGSLTAGMYIVTYKYNDAYFSKKVIIE